MCNVFKGLGIKVDFGKQFGISFKGIVKKHFWEYGGFLEILLGSTGTQTPLGTSARPTKA